MEVEHYTDKEYYKYNIAINKAVNKEETPVKQKHVRSAIIGTFNQQGAQIFWSIALRLPCMDDGIVAWKFCYILHKILREGHPLCVENSQRHRDHLKEIGKLWRHLEGYGQLIKCYIQVILIKLVFHRRNPRFPGNLSVTTQDLTSICQKNPDICFALSIEIFDYLDAILELQENIFVYKASSMTMQGQCRLTPIIPLIQDASRLYDHSVKIMFLLHDIVSYDSLSGHRDRFMTQFKQLKLFYQNTNALHYFRNLITVPPLPEYPPNFQANFETYVTQEVYVPPEEDDVPDTPNLIDTSVSDHNVTESTASLIQEHNILMNERDNIIRSLHDDCDKLKLEIRELYDRAETEKRNVYEHINTMETNLAIKESELVQEKQMNEILTQAHRQEEEQKKVEEKMKEERFKASYLKLREEHINLLRDKAKVEKNLKMGEDKFSELERTNIQLEQKMKETELHCETATMNFKQIEDDKSSELEDLQKNIATYTSENKVLQQNIDIVNKENFIIVEKLQLEQKKNEDIILQFNDLKQEIINQSEEITKLKSHHEHVINNILHKSLEENEHIMRNAIEEMENPAFSAVSCSPDYLRNLTDTCHDSLKLAADVSKNEPYKLIQVANNIAHTHATYILHGRAAANTSPDITFGDNMANACKIFGESIVDLLHSMKDDGSVVENLTTCQHNLNNVAALAESISSSVKGDNLENLESMLEAEIAAMDKSIEEAAKKMQEMLSKSREADSGIKLQVNEKILDTCTNLMHSIRVLVQKSKLLQAEIIMQGKGTASTKEFYKRNHRWTDGFLSAAKSIAVAANFLLNSADKAVSGEGKLELLVVAAQEISASTAQLVVACKVKADRKSSNLQQVTQASKDVTNATGTIVATVKDCSELIEDAKEVDTTNMTLHQAKRFEMEAQVRVLELEKELQQERVKLSSLRRHHYQLAGESEGWEKI